MVSIPCCYATCIAFCLKKTFWHEKSVVYHHLLEFIHTCFVSVSLSLSTLHLAWHSTARYHTLYVIFTHFQSSISICLFVYCCLQQSFHFFICYFGVVQLKVFFLLLFSFVRFFTWLPFYKSVDHHSSLFTCVPFGVYLVFCSLFIVISTQFFCLFLLDLFFILIFLKFKSCRTCFRRRKLTLLFFVCVTKYVEASSGLYQMRCVCACIYHYNSRSKDIWLIYCHLKIKFTQKKQGNNNEYKYKCLFLTNKHQIGRVMTRYGRTTADKLEGTCRIFIHSDELPVSQRQQMAMIKITKKTHTHELHSSKIKYDRTTKDK